MAKGQFHSVILDTTYLDDYRNAIRQKSLPWDAFGRSGLIAPNDATVLIELEKHAIDKKKLEKKKNSSDSHTNNSHRRQGSVDSYSRHGRNSLNENEATETEEGKQKKQEAERLEDEKLTRFLNTISNVLKAELPNERNDVLKFSLVKLSDLLEDEKFLQKVIDMNQIKEFLSSLNKFVSKNDEIVKLLSIYDSVSLIINFDEKDEASSNAILTELIKYLEITKNFSLKFLSLNILSELLIHTCKFYRGLFWSKHEQFLPIFFDILKDGGVSSSHGKFNEVSTNDLIQFHYKILLIIWMLSFDFSKINVFKSFYLSNLLNLLKILKTSIKEKSIRLIISILINLTNHPESLNSLEIVKFLILNGDFLSILNNLKERKWSDDELIKDLDLILEISSDIFDRLTSFDEYLQELNLRNFKNSPVHFKEEFFIDNVDKFRDSNFKVYKNLLELVPGKQLNSLSLKILLMDLEKLLKIDPSFLTVLIGQGKKTEIMELLSHKNSDVRYQALKITQFIVSQSLK